MSPVSLADEIRAVLWILDHRLSGPINVAVPAPLTNRDFTRVLASALHRPAFFAVPRAALDVVLGSEMAGELIFVSQRVVPTALVESGFHFEHPDAPSAVAWALAHAT
jgi:NAD dependent epimerase/dehydratase family enzyme